MRDVPAHPNNIIFCAPTMAADGVYHGYYRTDTRGQNLNRYYIGQPNRVGAGGCVFCHGRFAGLPGCTLATPGPPNPPS